MEVQLTAAATIVDKFETLMSTNSVSIPRHRETGSDMLPIRYLLQRIREGFSGTADEVRSEFTAAVAVHDLAAKVVEVSNHSDFACLIPHLRMLNDGAIHLTEEPPTGDVYNKLIELYWSSLCMSVGRRVELDHPVHSTGKNPDVITLNSAGGAAHAYAFKTVRSLHTQNVYEHIEKGIAQIEQSPAPEGIVALHLTPRIAKADFWPTGRYYLDWRSVAWNIVSELRETVSAVVRDNGQATIDELFQGKKAVGAVLCIAFCPVVAKHPLKEKTVVMPLKFAVLVDLYTGARMSADFFVELALTNHAMQTVLGVE